MTGELWVVNASPLITLAKVGRLPLLEQPGRTLAVPQAVAEEVRAGPPEDPARVALDAGFAGSPVATSVDPDVLEWSLGAGESSVLLLAKRDARITSAAEVLRALRHAGLYLDDTLVREALARIVGEPWEP